MEKLVADQVETDCLYPSFDRVTVFVTPLGDGFRVSDAGGAVRCAWLHGREGLAVEKEVARWAARYGAEVEGAAIYADVPSAEWRVNAILAVANASAQAANAALADFSA